MRNDEIIIVVLWVGELVVWIYENVKGIIEVDDRNKKLKIWLTESSICSIEEMWLELVAKVVTPTWQDTHFGTTNPKCGLVRG